MLPDQLIEEAENGNNAEGSNQQNTLMPEYIEYSMLSGHCGWVWDCDFTADNGFLITVCSDAKVRIWRMGKEEIRK